MHEIRGYVQDITIEWRLLELLSSPPVYCKNGSEGGCEKMLLTCMHTRAEHSSSRTLMCKMSVDDGMIFMMVHQCM